MSDLRKLLIAVAIFGGVISVAVCSLYGWKQATEIEDKIIAAIQYGFVAALTLALDVAVVRIWVLGWHKCACFIGLAAFGAFVMTASTSLGGMVTRADQVQADRRHVLDTSRDVQARIDELVHERKDLGAFKRTTQAAVDSAQRLAEATKLVKERECGNGDPRQRGPFCRQREQDEGIALAGLNSATRDKAATDRADAIDAELAALRVKRAATGDRVTAVNPLGATLSTIFGSVADKMTAWEKVVYAAIWDLVLLGLMVAIEVLKHAERLSRPAPSASTPLAVVIPPAPCPKLTGNKTKLIGNSQSQTVKRFFLENLKPARGDKVSFADIANRYVQVCEREEKQVVPPSQFSQVLDRFCQDADLTCMKIGGQEYLLDVRLMPVEASADEDALA